MTNVLLNTDSYKTSHYAQYPANAEFISSYIESRGGVYPHTVFFGLQAFIKQYLSQPFSQQDIDQADTLLSAHGVPFNRSGWQYILDHYDGFLPLEIQAVAGRHLPANRSCHAAGTKH